jgi:hypothetical protein
LKALLRVSFARFKLKLSIMLCSPMPYKNPSLLRDTIETLSILRTIERSLNSSHYSTTSSHLTDLKIKNKE